MEKKCDCEEISCRVGCSKKHTCKIFWCEKCRPPTRAEILESQPLPQNKDYCCRNIDPMCSCTDCEMMRPKEVEKDWEKRFEEEFVCRGGKSECKLPHEPMLNDSGIKVEKVKNFIKSILEQKRVEIEKLDTVESGEYETDHIDKQDVLNIISKH